MDGQSVAHRRSHSAVDASTAAAAAAAAPPSGQNSGLSARTQRDSPAADGEAAHQDGGNDEEPPPTPGGGRRTRSGSINSDNMDGNSLAGPLVSSALRIIPGKICTLTEKKLANIKNPSPSIKSFFPSSPLC